MMSKLQQIRRWSTDARPVFVCGLERSGTSTLQLALSRHPALFPVRDVYETFAFTQPQRLLEEPMPGMARASASSASLRDAAERGDSHAQYMLARRLLDGRGAEKDPARELPYSGFFLNLFNLTGSGTSTTTIVDLTLAPPYVDQTGEFAAAFLPRDLGANSARRH